MDRPVAKRVSAAPYFYGRITREEAEKILTIQGKMEGLYLLRECISLLGNYSIGICHSKGIHHYIIEKKSDGQYMIPDGKKFPGPIELIEHYSNNLDGFLTQPTIPCNRGRNQQAVTFRGMTYDDLEKEMVTRAKTFKDVNLERDLGPMRDRLIKLVARDLHLKQPWYHGKVSRNEAEKRIRKSGLRAGKFLIRQRDDKKMFALALSFEGSALKHYIIGVDRDEKFSIEDGPKFECLIMLIDHYHNKQDGLVCKLEHPCPNPSSSQADVAKYLRTYNEHLFDCCVRRTPSVVSNGFSQEFDRPLEEQAPPILNRRNSQRENIPLPPVPVAASAPVDDGDMAEPPEFRDEPPYVNLNTDDLEDDYMEVRRTEKRFELERSRLTLQEELGQGQFGFVFKGICRLGGKEIPVAIKKLKNEELVPGVEPELLREAKMMQELQNRNIVQMIGICKSDGIMLVLEIAPLGPLNKFLPKNKDLTEAEVTRLMLQVARGMAYLASQKFVHRDLAARNVLLVSKKHAKISDFGMSKALSRDSNYYEAATAGKWPLKWYALECILYWKFDSRSDVWSYGVTMWEAFSYGRTPYAGMKSKELVDYLETNQRLAKPERCPDAAYKIMMECWQETPRDRPSFAELVSKMETLHQNLLTESRDEPPYVNLKTDDLENETEIRRKEKRFELERSRLTLQEELGRGLFGIAYKGICRLRGKEIPVAIKKQNKEDIVPGVEPELVHEAKVMQELENRNILQMIGICKSDGVMLVLEIAPLGPLDKFLHNNKDLTEAEITWLMLEVARGMAYLESKKIVHRNLAARSILLFSKKHAKISSFVLSRVLSKDGDYYGAATAGKWRLKWYALECILYWKFDSRSDVWSYGVTMWEAFSYGGKPYPRIAYEELVEYLQKNQRLAKPEKCPNTAYKIMKECWQETSRDRPSFAELVVKMETLHQNL